MAGRVRTDVIGICGGNCEHDANGDGVCDDWTGGCVDLLDPNYEAVPEAMSVTDNCVTIPRDGSVYPNSIVCPINLRRDAWVSFSRFEVEDHANCTFDYLNISGTKYCGTGNSSTKPSTMYLSQDDDISFVSDGYVGMEGIVMCSHNQKPGCTDPDAENYDATAESDDGSCTYVDIPDECNKDSFVEYDVSGRNDKSCSTIDCTALIPFYEGTVYPDPGCVQYSFLHDEFYHFGSYLTESQCVSSWTTRVTDL